MKFGTHHYRPLIDELTVKQSTIKDAGLGLFATENLKAGVFLGVTHVWESNRHEWIRTPLGGFINHSDSPNMFISTNIHYHHGDQRELYTIRPIKKGEEMFVYYTVGYDDVLDHIE